MAHDLENGGSENRKALRRRALLPARIVYQQGAFTLEATIRNISDTGAKLLIPKGQAVPDELFMIDMKAGVAYQARIAWRRLPEIGLSFMNRYPMDDTLPRELRFLKTLWGGAMTRTDESGSSLA